MSVCEVCFNIKVNFKMCSKYELRLSIVFVELYLSIMEQVQNQMLNPLQREKSMCLHKETLSQDFTFSF